MGEGNISQTVKTDLVKGKERKDATLKPSPKERRRSPNRTDAREHLKSKHEKVESMYLHVIELWPKNIDFLVTARYLPTVKSGNSTCDFWKWCLGFESPLDNNYYLFVIFFLKAVNSLSLRQTPLGW